MPLKRTRLALQVAWERYRDAQQQRHLGGLRSLGPVRTIDHVQREMVAALLPLIIRFARRLAVWGVSVDELTAIGKTAVIQAQETYEDGHATCFKTYVFSAIGGRMLHWLRQVPAVDLHEPVRMQQDRRKVYAAENDLMEEGEDPSPQAVALRTGLPLKRVNAVRWTRESFRPTARFGEVREGNVDPALHPACGVEWVADADTRLVIADAMDRLPELQREVIRHRFFLQETLEEVDEALGLTRGRAWRIEQAALKRLRDWMA